MDGKSKNVKLFPKYRQLSRDFLFSRMTAIELRRSESEIALQCNVLVNLKGE